MRRSLAPRYNRENHVPDVVNQRLGPTPQRRSQVFVEQCSGRGQSDYRRPQASGYRPCEQDGVDVTEHRVLLRHAPAPKIIGPLELREEAFYLPSVRVSQADLFGTQPTHGNVGQVKVVFPGRLVPESNHAPFPNLGTMAIDGDWPRLALQADGNRDRQIEHLALQIWQDVTQGPPVERDRVAAACQVRVGDGGVEALLEPGPSVIG